MTAVVEAPVLVIGIGNILQADDGFGVRVVERLRERLAGVTAAVEILDGGTAGLGLLPFLEAGSRVLFVDAIDLGEAPGTPLRVDDAMTVAGSGAALSPHDLDLRDLLLAARLTGHEPAETVLLGVQPASTEFSTELTETVAGCVDDTVERVVGQLRAWGALD